jgi:hypothetical protein
MTPSVTEIMAPWTGADRVPFPSLATRAGLSRDLRREILDSGLIAPLPETAGQGKTPVITVEDALMFAAAVVLAFVAGLAVVTALRVIVKTGAEIGGETLQIPLPGP